MGCIGANLCFFAGPSIDAYLNWLGYRHSAITTVIFGLGLVFSMVLAAGFAMTAINPR